MFMPSELPNIQKKDSLGGGQPAGRLAGWLASQQKVPPSPGLIIISIIIIVMLNPPKNAKMGRGVLAGAGGSGGGPIFGVFGIVLGHF